MARSATTNDRVRSVLFHVADIRKDTARLAKLAEECALTAVQRADMLDIVASLRADANLIEDHVKHLETVR